MPVESGRTRPKELTNEQLELEIIRAKNTLDKCSMGSKAGLKQAHRWLDKLEAEKFYRQQRGR